MNEIWKVIEDYEDYEVSNLGRIKKEILKLLLKQVVIFVLILFL